MSILGLHSFDHFGCSGAEWRDIRLCGEGLLSRCIIFGTKFKGNVLSKPEGSWEYCKNVCGKRILATKYSRDLLICVRGMRLTSWWSMNFDLKFVTTVYRQN
jgi:hypothetical protein